MGEVVNRLKEAVGQQEVLDVGRDVASDDARFWYSFAALWAPFLICAVIFWIWGYRVFSFDAGQWLTGGAIASALFLSGVKIWDHQKRATGEWHSLGYNGKIWGVVGYIPADESGPELVVAVEGVHAFLQHIPTRGNKVINRADGVLALNEKHYDSNTIDRGIAWDGLPTRVQQWFRTPSHADAAGVKFRGGTENGVPVPGTKFVFGQVPRFKHFMDEEYELDVDYEVQLETESRARSQWQRVAAHEHAATKSVSEHGARATMRQAKLGRPVRLEEGEEEREEEPYGG